MPQARIRKAVLPVAGLGTRFLPATKASPKEMMPVVDKPLVQYVVKEAIAAGITELIFVTNNGKGAIENHFDRNVELEAKLLAQGKTELYHLVRDILPEGVTAIYIRQPEPLGLGHAIWCARSVVGQESFAVLLADDLIDSSLPCLQQLIACYQNFNTSVVALERLAWSETVHYGVVAFKALTAQLGKIRALVEKPSPEMAPSQLGVVGRYILTPAIFSYLERLLQSTPAEIQLTDALAGLLAEEEIHGLIFSGQRFDCGSKLGYLKAVIHYGLQHPEIGAAFQEYLKGETVVA